MASYSLNSKAFPDALLLNLLKLSKFWCIDNFCSYSQGKPTWQGSARHFVLAVCRSPPWRWEVQQLGDGTSASLSEYHASGSASVGSPSTILNKKHGSVRLSIIFQKTSNLQLELNPEVQFIESLLDIILR